MKEKTLKSLIYKDLGFPIRLTNVPMKKIFGEWVLDINLNKLQAEALNLIIHKPTPLQKEEIRFIRKYFEMTTTAFGEVFGVTHAAVLKWESGQLPPPTTDLCIRLFAMDQLKAKNEDIGKLYHEVNLKGLAKSRTLKRRKQISMDARAHRFYRL